MLINKVEQIRPQKYHFRLLHCSIHSIQSHKQYICACRLYIVCICVRSLKHMEITCHSAKFMNWNLGMKGPRN